MNPNKMNEEQRHEGLLKMGFKQITMFPVEFKEMESVRVTARLSADIRDPRVRIVATVVCRGNAPDTYMVRTLSGRILTAHWTEMESIER